MIRNRINDVKYSFGDWCVVHPDELIATFFLSLPEPISLPNAPILPQYEKLIDADIDKLDDLAVQFEFGPISDAEADPQGLERILVGTENWTNKYLFRSSLVFHPALTLSILTAGLDASAAVAKLASDGPIDTSTAHPVMAAGGSAGDSQYMFNETEMRDAGIGAVTVAEVAIPLRLIGEIPGIEQPVQGGIEDFPELAAFREGLPERVTTPAYSDLSTISNPEYMYRARLVSSLHLALSEVRGIQRAYHIATRDPITLLTHGRLAVAVPVTVRKLQDIKTPGLATTFFINPHQNYWPFLRRPDLDGQKLHVFHSARQYPRRYIQDYFDFRREAEVALTRSSDTRLAMLMFGLAAEVFLDQLLLHLIWEEGTTPEQAAEAWRQAISDRIKADYSVRLGGFWDTRRNGPIRDWHKLIAHMRNRVAHVAYTPTFNECATAWEALDALVKYVSDRLARPERLRLYPRTALAIMGEPGLRRRQAYNRRLTELLDSQSEPLWLPTYERWHQTFRRLRSDLQGDPRVPDLDGASIIAVVEPNGQVSFFACDRSCGQSIAITPTAIPPDAMNSISNLATNLPADRTEPFTAELYMDDRKRLVTDGEWVEAYRHLPGWGVMVNGRDRQGQGG
jgi:hypothetical protein